MKWMFIILYFNNFTLLRPEILYVILARHNELPQDDILNVETCRSMLFVIIVLSRNLVNEETLVHWGAVVSKEEDMKQQC